MKKNVLLILVALIVLASCNTMPENEILPSWKDGAIKEKIISFIQRDTSDIPVEDRIAVFDMDGTIICEKPLWFEMYCSVAKLYEDLQGNPDLIKYKSYQYAKVLYENPSDTTVKNNWVTDDVNYIDSMNLKAFEGETHEYYVSFCSKYLDATVNKDKNMVLGDMFYKPMLELIKYLSDNYYKVYIVSGSYQGVIWSIVPEKTGLKRYQLVGSRLALTPVYSNNNTQFIIQKGIFTPKNNYAGKPENIYSKLGKTPVFAFGNTTGDFDMLHYAITNKHKGVGFMLNHDDPREYVYPPYYSKTDPGWKKMIDSFGGTVVDMQSNFDVIW